MSKLSEKCDRLIKELTVEEEKHFFLQTNTEDEMKIKLYELEKQWPQKKLVVTTLVI